MRRLGVKQRERLTHGLTAPPHMLLMSATPIPRTLAILQYGGMTLSSIRELPLGRSPVETYVVNDDEQDRKKVRLFMCIHQLLGWDAEADWPSCSMAVAPNIHLSVFLPLSCPYILPRCSSTAQNKPMHLTLRTNHAVPLNVPACGCLQVYEDIKQEISSGGRAYIVCPLVNDSDAMEGVRTVEAEYMRLSSSGVCVCAGRAVCVDSVGSTLWPHSMCKPVIDCAKRTFQSLPRHHGAALRQVACEWAEVDLIAAVCCRVALRNASAAGALMCDLPAGLLHLHNPCRNLWRQQQVRQAAWQDGSCREGGCAGTLQEVRPVGIRVCCACLSIDNTQRLCDASCSWQHALLPPPCGSCLCLPPIHPARA